MKKKSFDILCWWCLACASAQSQGFCRSVYLWVTTTQPAEGPIIVFFVCVCVCSLLLWWYRPLCVTDVDVRRCCGSYHHLAPIQHQQRRRREKNWLFLWLIGAGSHQGKYLDKTTLRLFVVDKLCRSFEKLLIKIPLDDFILYIDQVCEYGIKIRAFYIEKPEVKNIYCGWWNVILACTVRCIASLRSYIHI